MVRHGGGDDLVRTAARDGDRHRASGLSLFKFCVNAFPRRSGDAVYGDDTIARLHACWRHGLRHGDDVGGLVFVHRRWNAEPPEKSPENYQCEQEIHEGSGDGDDYALPARAREEFVTGAGAFFERIIAGHAHVTSERESAEAVIGVTALHAEEARA